MRRLLPVDPVGPPLGCGPFLREARVLSRASHPVTRFLPGRRALACCAHRVFGRAAWNASASCPLIGAASRQYGVSCAQGKEVSSSQSRDLAAESAPDEPSCSAVSAAGGGFAESRRLCARGWCASTPSAAGMLVCIWSRAREQMHRARVSGLRLARTPMCLPALGPASRAGPKWGPVAMFSVSNLG